MRRPSTTPRQVVEIDPVWLQEWIDYGMTELYAYLDKHAQFAAYLERHNREEHHA